MDVLFAKERSERSLKHPNTHQGDHSQLLESMVDQSKVDRLLIEKLDGRSRSRGATTKV
jgi:hypothetical protein